MIRQADVEDLPRLERLARRFYESSKFLRGFDPERFVSVWTSILNAGSGVIFIEENHDGRPIGALGGVRFPELYSGKLVATEFFWFVEPQSRGRGLKYYGEFEKWARGAGCQEIRMVHLADSMPGRLERVYRRWGFEEMERHYRKELT